MANPCRFIHETIIKDVIDMIHDIRDLDPDDLLDASKRHHMSRTSLAKKTSGVVMVFPLMVSTSLTIDTAVMLMKAHERKCATMVQLLFGAFSVESFEDIEQLIGSFHRNIKLGDKMSVDDAIGILDSLSEGQHIEPQYSQLMAIKEDMKNISFYLEENINPQSLNNIRVSSSPDGYMIEGFQRPRIGAPGGFGTNRYDGLKVRNQQREKMLLATDVKKANELVPTMLNVNIWATTKDGKHTQITDGIVGVKCRLVPVESNDIINHIVSKTADANWLFQFIRATTREISFIKDFLLAIDQAKVDALANSRRGSSNPMWKVLERRAFGSRWKRLMGSSNAYMAITSLALSQEDVDYMIKEHSIDFREPAVVSNLFDKYNLMAAMIADESLEVCNFMYDTGEGNWESYSFTSLEREDKDNTYKKVVNLMTKVAR